MNKQESVEKSRVSGVILIDKPQGLTSQQVVSNVKYLFKSEIYDSRKAGHTGTLDPMATGLLPVCMGEATKFSHYQLDADKSYIATIQLGAQTDTGDAEGKVIATKPLPVLNQTLLNEVAKRFQGDIQQIPPMYSALKKDGKKLYEYARAGVEIERKPRPITIKKLSLNLCDSPDGSVTNTLLLNVTCSKGTYVRVLGEDIAAALGTLGYLSALRRTQVGHFDVSNAISLNALEDLTLQKRFSHLLPIDACIADIPILTISDSQCQRLRMGQRLNLKDELTSEILIYMQEQDRNIVDAVYDVRLFDNHQQFVGLGKLQKNGRLQPKKIIQVD